ncbi:MAG: hypothetical protein KF753_05570 [Caldilineaceae bacterium]|nr:hypothetical protein [Caldilineaceae bacterium]
MRLSPVADEQPAITNSTYVSHVARTLWENLPGLLWSALFFNLACIPAFVLLFLGLVVPGLLVMAVTAGPAWAALQEYTIRMADWEATNSRIFFKAVIRHWRSSALLTLLTLFPWLALWTTLPLLQISPVPLVVWLGLGADFLGIVVLSALSLYTFPLLVRRNTPIRDTLRDGLILISRYPSNTTGLLALGILFGFAIAYLSLGLLFFLPVIYSLFIATNSLLVFSQEA